MFVSLIGGDKNFANQLCAVFGEYLNNGYTYQDIKTELFKCFYDKKHIFRWNLFQKKKNGDIFKRNLLKTNTRYYHKELKLLNALPVIEHDMNSGTITSRTSEYYLEPVASYTIQEYIQYFYKVMPVDLQAQPPSQMSGFLKYKVEKYGIDKLLFMTDLFAETCKQNETVFNVKDWDEYSAIADNLMTEIKSHFAENKPYYTVKKRRLFDV